MTPAQTALLARHNVATLGNGRDVHFGYSDTFRIAFEPYCQLRAGIYQVNRIGAFTYMGGGRSVFRNIDAIGRFCAIASGIVAGLVEHPTDGLSPHPVMQGGWNPGFAPIDAFVADSRDTVVASKRRYIERFGDRATRIVIGNDVWIGEGAFIRRGVTIGDGAVVAARSVVVKDVPPYAIVGGIPARVIRLRFAEPIVERLLALQWWRYGLGILSGVDTDRIEAALEAMEDKVASGAVTPFEPEVFVFEG